MIGIHAIISLMKQDLSIKPFNITRLFCSLGLVGVVRLSASLCSRGSWGSRGSCSSRLLLSKVRRFLFFLIGVGFLSVVLAACAGGGDGSSADGGSEGNRSMDNGSMGGDSEGNGSMVGGPGTGGDGEGNGENGSSESFDVALTFAPISGGFRIGNQSDFGNFTSLKITATSGSGTPVEKDIDISEFADDSSYDFTGLADRDWKFAIIGILSDGEEREVRIVFVWQANEADHEGGGIRSGLNTDGDGRADSVDEDDDNDGVRDSDEAAGCVLVADCDNDGTMDGADLDDDGDGLIELATAAELDWVRYALDGSGRRRIMDGTLNTSGCVDGGGTNICSGYELVRNISLAAYADNEGGKGWQPLGHDTNNNELECHGDAFSGIFEGNGWTISDLNISRSDEDCVGLFGHIAGNSEIRNLTLSAESVIGRSRVGGLVGDGEDARIHSSSVVVAEVSGDNTNVGGLVGVGPLANITSSAVVVGEVSGSSSVGGLVGWGDSARVYSSLVVAGSVSGDNRIGGLVGRGDSARIHSSSVVVDEVRGKGSALISHVGGLVGQGQLARIHSSSVVMAEVSGGLSGVGGLVGVGPLANITSSAVVMGEVSGGLSGVGGLVGSFVDGKVAYSYVVSGNKVAMLAGGGTGASGVASYWDSDTSGVTSVDSENIGEPKTTIELRNPTDYTGIYANWTKDMGIFGDEDVPLAVWCDEDNSGSIEADERDPSNRVWDFGTNMEYPAIRCTPIEPDEWRSWWYLEGTPAKPQLNRTRLDELLP